MQTVVRHIWLINILSNSGAITVDRKYLHDIDFKQISSDIEKIM